VEIRAIRGQPFLERMAHCDREQPVHDFDSRWFFDEGLLAYFTGPQSVQNYLSSQGSSTMPALTFSEFGAVVVSFPHKLEIQNAIVSKLDDLHEETQRLAGLSEQKRAALETLQKSLLHQAFTEDL